MRRVATLLVPLIAFPMSVARAQWRIGADAASLHFGALAIDTASAGRRATLGSATAAGVRIERQIARVRVALRVGSGRAGFAIEDDSVSVGIKNVFRFVELTPEVAAPVIATAAGASLWVEAGPVLGIWMPDGSDTRLRAGAFGGASVVVPLATRVTGMFGVHATVTGSPFEETELVPGFALRTMPRVAAQVGVRYRL
jgi:hypothetical protein